MKAYQEILDMLEAKIKESEGELLSCKETEKKDWNAYLEGIPTENEDTLRTMRIDWRFSREAMLAASRRVETLKEVRKEVLSLKTSAEYKAACEESYYNLDVLPF